MDDPADAAMLESMAISDADELCTADGVPDVELYDSNLPQDPASAHTADKENKGAQRAGEEARSSTVSAFIFGTHPPSRSISYW